MKKTRKITAILLALLFTSSIAFTACEGGESYESDSVNQSTASESVDSDSSSAEHEHSWSYKTTKKATCTEKGEKTGSCNCGATTVEEIPVNTSAHEYVWTETLAPTCETAGKETGTCAHDPSHTTTRKTEAIGHDWIWSLSDEFSCTDEGEQSAVCRRDSTHTTSKTISAHGHAYKNGVCSECTTVVTLPDSPSTITYVNNYDAGNPFEEAGEDGSDFNRYTVDTEQGYYEFELGANGSAWVSLTVPESGQYAMYSLQNADGVKATRYDASTHYIPGAIYNDDGEVIGYSGGEEARVFTEDGLLPATNFYSDVNCSQMHYSEDWRATWQLTGDAGDIVRVRFVRVADAAWIPSTVRTSVIPTQIQRTYAPEGGEGVSLSPMPYSGDYFYDETTGYYRRGTAEKPGKIIFVAITVSAPRLFVGGAGSAASFTSIMDDGGRLDLQTGKDAEGNYLVADYAPFIMKSYATNYGNCYQNYVNKDGVYPVTQELFEFLNLYVSLNKPVEIPDSIWEDEALREKYAWLAPCYFYAALTQGTEERPVQLTAEDLDKDLTVTTKLFDFVYYNVKCPAGFYTVSCDNENALIRIGEKQIQGAFSITFEADETTGMTFRLSDKGGKETALTLRISKTQPLPVSALGALSVSTSEAVLMSGKLTNIALFSYEATTAGTLTVEGATLCQVTVEENEETNLFIIRFESDVIVTEEVTLVFTPND